MDGAHGPCLSPLEHVHLAGRSNQMPEEPWGLLPGVLLASLPHVDASHPTGSLLISFTGSGHRSSSKLLIWDDYYKADTEQAEITGPAVIPSVRLRVDSHLRVPTTEPSLPYGTQV